MSPRVNKYQDVNESVQKEVTDRLMQATIAAMRTAIAAQMQAELKVVDPVLAKQYQQRLSESEQQVRGQQEAMKQLERERAQLMSHPATMPSTLPATVPIVAPASSATIK